MPAMSDRSRSEPSSRWPATIVGGFLGALLGPVALHRTGVEPAWSAVGGAVVGALAGALFGERAMHLVAAALKGGRG